MPLGGRVSFKFLPWGGGGGGGGGEEKSRCMQRVHMHVGVPTFVKFSEHF